MLTNIAAHVFTTLAILVVAFQIALAMGAPWGHLTMGGKFQGKLPQRMRGVAVFSAVLLVVFALIVETRAGFLFPQFYALSKGLIWVVVAYCALGVVMNAITPSKSERALWLPVVLGMLACSLIVTLGR
jgi:hypothetical protein